MPDNDIDITEDEDGLDPETKASLDETARRWIEILDRFTPRKDFEALEKRVAELERRLPGT